MPGFRSVVSTYRSMWIIYHIAAAKERLWFYEYARSDPLESLCHIVWLSLFITFGSCFFLSVIGYGFEKVFFIILQAEPKDWHELFVDNLFYPVFIGLASGMNWVFFCHCRTQPTNRWGYQCWSCPTIYTILTGNPEHDVTGKLIWIWLWSGNRNRKA